MTFLARYYFLVPLKSIKYVNGFLNVKKQTINKNKLSQTNAFNKQLYALSENRRRRDGLYYLNNV